MSRIVRKITAVFAAATIASAVPDTASAILLDPNTVGSNPLVTLNDGAFLDPNRTDEQSTFNVGISSSTASPTTTEGNFFFNTIPVVYGSSLGVDSRCFSGCFEFLFDKQETQNAPELTITDIVIDFDDGANGVIPIWEYTGYDPLTGSGALETQGITGSGGSTVVHTDSPLGNGADVALLIPVSVFVQAGQLTSTGFFDASQAIRFEWTQELANNGGDEWVLRGCDAPDVVCFTDNQIIRLTPVPLPAGLWLMLGAIGTFVALRRRPGVA